MKLTIDTKGYYIVVRDPELNVLKSFKTCCNPAALAQAILWAETNGEIDWDASQVAKPEHD